MRQNGGVNCAWSQNEQTIYFQNKNVQKRGMHMRFWAILGENTLLYVPFCNILILNLNETPF